MNFTSHIQILTPPLDNDICIIDRPNCCTKSTEERLLTKTKEIFKNRIFLVLNELLGKIDKDNKVKLRK